MCLAVLAYRCFAHLLANGRVSATSDGGTPVDSDPSALSAAVDDGHDSRRKGATSDAGRQGFDAKSASAAVSSATVDTRPPQTTAPASCRVSQPSTKSAEVGSTELAATPAKPASEDDVVDREVSNMKRYASRDNLALVGRDASPSHDADHQWKIDNSEAPQKDASTSGVDVQSTVGDDDANFVPVPVRRCSSNSESPETRLPDLRRSLLNMIQLRNVESLTGAAGLGSFTTSQRSGQKILNVDNGSVELGTMSRKPFRRKSPLVNDRLGKLRSETDQWLDDEIGVDVFEGGELERTVEALNRLDNDKDIEMSLKPSTRKSPVVNDKRGTSQLETDLWLDDDSDKVDELEPTVKASIHFDDDDDDKAMSLKPSRRKSPVEIDRRGKSQLETDLQLDDKTGVNVRMGRELEHTVTPSNELDDDDDDDDNDGVSTASIMAQLRQLSNMMDQKPPAIPPAAPPSDVRRQPPDQLPSQQRTKPAGKSHKPVPNVSAKSSRGVSGRLARGRTYDQPTISATAKQAGPIFTWNKPSSSKHDDNKADTSGGASATRRIRKRPQLDDRGKKTAAAVKPAVRVSSNTVTSDSQVKGRSKSSSRRQSGTAARQSKSTSRSAADTKNSWSQETVSNDVPHCNLSNTNFGYEISDLATRLLDPGSDEAALPAINSADARHRSGGSADATLRRRDGGCGASQQTVEDVYVEAMSLDAEGRVSGRSSIAWRQEIARIIDSLRHQLCSRELAKPANDRLNVLTNEDLEQFKCFTQLTARQKSKR